MNVFNKSWLISEVPAELLLGLGIYFAATAVILLALSIDAGHYPEFSVWLRTFLRDNPWTRHARCWCYFSTPCGRPADVNARGNS